MLPLCFKESVFRVLSVERLIKSFVIFNLINILRENVDSIEEERERERETITDAGMEIGLGEIKNDKP
jgi:hypothetical protein